MAERTLSYDALSPRFRGFDAYFAREVVPAAPALAAQSGRIWPLAALVALGAIYAFSAVAALLFWPAETAGFRPWAIASFVILLPGLVLAVATLPSNEPEPVLSAADWRAVRRRVARFFGLDLPPPPGADELSTLVAAAPSPAAASAFEATARVAGVVASGPARGVRLDFVEGVVDGAPAAIFQLAFPGRYGGIAALLDRRIDGVSRAGMAAMATTLPESAADLEAYADAPNVAARLTASPNLARLAELGRDIGAPAFNLAIVDDGARLYLPLAEPIFADPAAETAEAGVGLALFDFDALIRFAESLSALFVAPALGAPAARRAAS